MQKCVLSSSYLRSASWNSEELLCNAILNPSILSKWQKSSMKDVVLHDMHSEKDSEYFSKAIHELNISFSEDFLAFERLWLKDEFNHYMGFRYLLGLIFEESISEVEKHSLPPDFGTLIPLLQDEFHLCLLLAYDEIVTTKLYISEYSSYDEAADPFISRWIRYVARDEAYHFGNLLKIMLTHYPHRVHEIPMFVEQLINYELSIQNYGKTFVLDRAGYRLSRSFLLQCVQPLLTFVRKHISNR